MTVADSRFNYSDFFGMLKARQRRLLRTNAGNIRFLPAEILKKVVALSSYILYLSGERIGPRTPARPRIDFSEKGQRRL
jgi:hypothetical protein